VSSVLDSPVAVVAVIGYRSSSIAIQGKKTGNDLFAPVKYAFDEDQRYGC